MRTLTALILSFAVSGCALATTLSWEHPTTREDDSPLALEEIDGYRVYCDEPPVETPSLVDTVGPVTSWEVDLDSGEWTCQLKTVDTSGLQSEFSESITFNHPSIYPGTPGNFLVEWEETEVTVVDQLFEDWSDYNLGDDPTVDPPAGETEPRWELRTTVPANTTTTFTVMETAQGVRFLRISHPGSYQSREQLVLVPAGDVTDAEIYALFESRWNSSGPRHLREGFRISPSGANLETGNGYEVRSNMHRMRRIVSGAGTYLVDERPGPTAADTLYHHLTSIETDGNNDPHLRGKMWENGTSEPATDLWTYTDTHQDAITAAGAVGIAWQANSTANVGYEWDVYEVGVGWNGQPAPREGEAEPVPEVLHGTVTQVQNDGSGPLSGNVEVPNQQNRVTYAAVWSWSPSGDINTPTIDGEPMTEVVALPQSATSSDSTMRLFKYENHAVGTFPVVVSVGGTPESIQMMAWTAYNVNLTVGERIAQIEFDPDANVSSYGHELTGVQVGDHLIAMPNIWPEDNTITKPAASALAPALVDEFYANWTVWETVVPSSPYTTNIESTDGVGEHATLYFALEPIEPSDEVPVVESGETSSLQMEGLAGLGQMGVTAEAMTRSLEMLVAASESAHGHAPAGEQQGLSVEASPGLLGNGHVLPGVQRSLAMNALNGFPVIGQQHSGVLVSASLEAVPGASTHGQAIPGGTAQLQLVANPGLVDVGQVIPMIIDGVTSDLGLFANNGQPIIGQRLDSETVSISLQPFAGDVLAGDSIVITGVTAGLSFAGEPGNLLLGQLLEGATILVSTEAQNGNVFTGHVVTGSPALMELLSNAGEVFTGLTLVTPIKETTTTNVTPLREVSNIVSLKEIHNVSTSYSTRVMEE